MSSYLDTLAEIDRAVTFASIEELVRSTARPLGYDRFVMFSVAPTQEHFIDRIFWLEGDWFGDGSRVDASSYLRHCPVNRHILHTDEAFFWAKTTGSGGQEKYYLEQKPKGPGIHGLQVPVFGRNGLAGALSLGGLDIDHSLRTRLLLTSIGTHAFLATRRLLQHPDQDQPLGLSAREGEILQLVASGWRQAEIAAVLGLSERTVENHLRRARQRLGVATTAQAVNVALRGGIIER